ncbi:Hypothetical protein CINCED_3A017453 [Cinara cedri]|uniref:Uncharacterized protein n=2 Tax=Cinara cedri TaxID=506608 RepID=A0A5E4N027_9HEMI|nr:Hypothetical protein CINCED_3A021691 [Cinara cedri]VVC39071.1 Hypothetical protein CINCED_3A017453 [Cinara cedri]
MEEAGDFRKMNYDISKYNRSKTGGKEELSACIVDIQFIKRQKKSKGYDIGKKVNGGKRHIITAFVLVCYVGAANESDRDNAAIGPKHGKSKMSTQGEEAIIVTFRKHILLPLDNCLYSLRAIIPCLTRSSLHHCLQRHGISILSDVEGEIKAKKKFKLFLIYL